MTIDDWRNKIDVIDNQILQLLNERATCAIEVGKIKKSINKAIYSPEREKAIFVRLAAQNKGPLNEKSIKTLFERIIDESRHIERKISNHE